ncbi:MAG: tetratricopeptide repeat protein [Planctomycetes bacterium]|nr:tetratricopeptide repeat protein [Planctomycetota bacterium]MCH9726259.1 tetratricopeptide repeat protein [Planctomycetota bacterium]MCH9776647.1 tetratricopeptide repeat protein [Planctomycetota bacterium]MCH9791598.1 tetratricopeptide repeat protein [Planctomycetota bacterium]
MSIQMTKQTWIAGIACALLVCNGCSNMRNSIVSKADDSAPVTLKEKISVAKNKLKDPGKFYVTHGQLQEKMGDTKAARSSYEVALGENPKSVEAVLGLARLDQVAGRKVEAEKGFQKALEMAPNDPKVRSNIGQFYAAEEKWDQAIVLLSEAVKSTPADKNVRYQLGIAMASSGDYQGAMPHLIRAVGEAEAHYNIGYILRDRGQMQASEQQFLQAVLLKPEFNEAQYWLDEIRREKENRLMLAGVSASESKGVNAGTRQASYSQAKHQQTAQIKRQKPGVSKGMSPAGVGAPNPKTGPRPRSARSATPPTNLTAEQLEQWRNQRQF